MARYQPKDFVPLKGFFDYKKRSLDDLKVLASSSYPIAPFVIAKSDERKEKIAGLFIYNLVVLTPIVIGVLFGLEKIIQN